MNLKNCSLKNYTSGVPVHTTIANIEAYLAQCGVSAVSKQFADGVPSALYFHIDLGGKKYTVRLPAKVKEVRESLWQDYRETTSRPRKNIGDFTEQAARTAWKIQQDWVQVQMSLIKLKQADFIEVFMGFIWDGTQTYYEQVMAGGLKALPESTG